ncbi:MAG TPA: MFS transporter [Thermomicrobiaceae bacterium]|nr:MFS transporter [Thermomicrobiaceae bacterium]
MAGDRLIDADGEDPKHADSARVSTVAPPTVRPVRLGRRLTSNTFSAFEVPAYRWFFLSSIAGTVGYQMQGVALGWLVYILTGSAVHLGLITTTQAICQVAVSPMAGVIADRVERRTYIMLVRLITVVTAAVLAALIVSHRITFPELVIGAAIFGVGFGLNGPARQALLAQLVGNERLINAVSLMSGGMNLMRIVGPAAAGFLIGAIGVPGIYVLLVLCYLGVIAALVPVPPQPVAPRHPGRNAVGDLVDGISYSYRHPAVFGLLLLGTVPLFFAMPYVPLLPVFAEGIWHTGATGFGILSAAPGIGGFIGALAVASFTNFHRKGRLTIASVSIYGLSLSAFALAPSFHVAVVFLMVAGVAAVAYSATVSSLVQSIIPNEMRGRVMSFYQMSFGISGLSALPVSAIASSIGTPVAVAGCGILVVMSGLLIYRLRPVLGEL